MTTRTHEVGSRVGFRLSRRPPGTSLESNYANDFWEMHINECRSVHSERVPTERKALKRRARDKWPAVRCRVRWCDVSSVQAFLSPGRHGWQKVTSIIGISQLRSWKNSNANGKRTYWPLLPKFAFTFNLQTRWAGGNPIFQSHFWPVNLKRKNNNGCFKKLHHNGQILMEKNS